MKWSDKEGINREDHRAYLDSFAKQFYDGITNLLDRSVSLENELLKDNLYIEVWNYNCIVICLSKHLNKQIKKYEEHKVMFLNKIKSNFHCNP